MRLLWRLTAPSGETPETHVYLLGVYLGDGCISTYPPWRLQAPACARRGLPEDHRRGSAGHEGRHAFQPSGHHLAIWICGGSSYSKAWPCLLPQHGPGKKHLRPITLTRWQRRHVARHPQLLLRGLLHSDGCRFLNTGRAWSHPRYAFSTLSTDIRQIFIEACAQLGLRWTTSGRTVYVSRKADVAILDSFVGPKA